MTIAALLLDPPAVQPSGSLDAMVVNRGDQPLEHGLAYRIERWDGEHWQQTDIAPDVFPAIALIVGPGETGRPNTVQIPEEVGSGFYRITKSVTTKGRETALDVHALFQVR